MSTIQVDMFEVQLGAAMLLQFRMSDGGVVRVLADGGLGHAKNYSVTHVRDALKRILDSEDRRIDLLVGTHYDADHLKGLVPIIEDETIEIGEAWMPPVADDTSTKKFVSAPDTDDMLGVKFSNEGGENILERYLSNKQYECDQILRLRSKQFNYKEGIGPSLERWQSEIDREGNVDFSFFEKIFQNVEKSQNQVGCCHTSPNIEEPLEPSEQIDFVTNLDFSEKNFFFADIFDMNHRITRLGMLVKGPATDAITAKSLKDVTVALKSRLIPTFYRTIDEGEPRRFIWHSQDERFVPDKAKSTKGPVLTLLGPSDRLIRKHQNRLPVMTLMKYAQFTDIPLDYITPSNQLSYIMKFHYEGQNVLVTGDAGCVDFNLKPRSKKYHPKLLAEMFPLEVVQIAHHGGNNAHFYRVLLEAGFAKQSEKSYLLLSHATDDKHRPSSTFGKFIENIRKEDDNNYLLFTSRPRKNKVIDYLDLIHKVIGHPGDVGHVRLTFGNNKWKVEKHAVKVA